MKIYTFLAILGHHFRKNKWHIFGPFSNIYAIDSRNVLLIIDHNDQLHPIGIAIQVRTPEVVGGN